LNCNISKTVRNRKLRFGEDGFQIFPNCLVNSQKIDLRGAKGYWTGT